MLNRLDKWHKTRAGLVLFAVVELAMAYGFASLAIDRGNFWWYLLALLLFVGTLKNLFSFVVIFFNRRPIK